MDILTRLLLLEERCLDGFLLEAPDIQFLFETLQSDASAAELSLALQILCHKQASVLPELCARFDSFPTLAQTLCIATLATVHHYTPQNFLVTLLARSEKADYIALIQAGLIHSPYDVSPVLLAALEQHPPAIHSRFWYCINARGFSKIQPYLLTCLSLPHEKELRHYFGDACINTFQADKEKKLNLS
ncbi:MAG: hypothetical protein VW378_06930 [bacterium]